MRTFLLFFALSTLANLSAQEPYALRLDKKTGLPSQSVYDLHQDKQGFIWLASDVGLTRYDGFKFETFYSDQQSSFSGSCIHEDAFGRIWYENFDGFLYYFNPKTKKLESLQNRKSIGFLPYAITQKYLFHTDLSGINVYDLISLKKIKSIPIEFIDPQHSGFMQSQFMIIDYDVLYTIDDQLQLKSHKIDFVRNKPRQVYPLNDTCFAVFNKFNDQQALFILNSDFELVKKIKVSNVKLIFNVNFIDGRIWISTPLGTHVYALNGRFVNHYFPESSISGVLKDRQNNYWFSTTNQGVFIVPNLENEFLFGNDHVPCKQIKFKNGSYLISTKKGQIIQVDRNLHIIEVIVNKPEHGEIFYMHYDDKTDILSYTGNRFYQLNASTLKPISVPQFSVKELVYIDNKYLAFAASNVSGFLIYNKGHTSEWDVLKSDSSRVYKGFFQNQRTRSVAFNRRRNVVYFATNNGLFEVSKTKIREIKMDSSTFFAARLTVFDNQLHALSTKGNLYKIDENLNFELLNGRFDVSEYDIRFLRNFGDKLIFASSSFVYQISSNADHADVYSLNISEYDINDIFLDKDKLFLVINDGVIKISLNRKKILESKPVLALNKIVSKDLEFTPGKKVLLSYDHNEVNIHYSILDFGKSIPRSLYYRINNSAWTKTSPLTRELNFPSLETGEYKVDFKLQDLNEFYSIAFIIDKPWWEEVWFMVLVVFLLMALGFNYYRIRVRNLSVQNRLLEENVELEKNLRQSVLTTIKSQMNPHFLYNALNTIHAYIYANDKENAGKYLIKFSKLTRKVLEMSEQENVGLDEELETILLYLELEKARFDEDFNFELDTKDVSHHEFIRVPPMLIQPYIENAIKHGLLHKSGEKKLKIKLAEENGKLVVTIDDNGIGRKRSGELNAIKAKSHKSFSSDANAKRIEVLNYGKSNKVSISYIDKLDEKGNSTGTTVVLRIPINN